MATTEHSTAPDRYAVMGHPVHHSRSPFIHARFAQQCAQHLVYEAIDVLPENFTSTVADFFAAGGRGLNITVPHKLAAYGWAHSLSERARRAGAVNTLAVQGDGTVLGDNTDGAGLVRDLTANLGCALHAQRILMLGAGGAARGGVEPLLAQHPAALVIANRSAERALALAAQFQDLRGESILLGCGFEALTGAFDLIINATSASLSDALPPLHDALLKNSTFCYDMAYGEQPTIFVRWARAHSLRAEMGLGMLVEQAAESFFLWRGIRPDTTAVLHELNRRQ